MSRSKWKGFFQDKIILNKLFLVKQPLKIWSRSSVVSSFFLNKNVLITTGNGFKRVFITRSHLGYKFGEFAATRGIKKTKKKITKK